MFLLLILAGSSNLPRVNIDVPIAPLASKQLPHISLQSLTGSKKKNVGVNDGRKALHP